MDTFKHQVDKKKNIVSLKINTETKGIDQIQTENQRKETDKKKNYNGNSGK